MIRILLAMVVSFMFIGCSNVIREIPAGYVGKVLTPSGWQNEIREAGQVDIGTVGGNGTYNTLVLLEATSTAVKESFGQAMGNDKEEDRKSTRLNSSHS